ncbi:MAG: hypothetical protein RR409_09815 [Clostridium sp.]
MILAIFRIIFFNDPEVTGISYKKQLEQASSLKQNLYSIIDNATRDFDIYNVVRQGLFVWESPSFSILQNTVKTF